MKFNIPVCLAVLVCSYLKTNAQINFTANDFGHVPAYNGYFRYGTNGGWYGSSWDDQSCADIAAGNPSKNVKGVSSKTFRPPLPETFLEYWGYNIRVPEFNHYATLGVADNTIFLGEPSAAHKDNNTYAGCPDQSKLFKNMYEPIWDGGANGTPVNDNNYFALYVYKTVTLYKSYTKFWEIINEPDYDSGGGSYLARGVPGNWWENNPPPCDLPNMKAPVFHYIRLLRIAYEVIKSVDPTAYITTGGLGYPSFVDAVLRNTDNPVDGSVTAEYPNKGGAYFDVLSFHSYPMYNLASWSNVINGWVYKRHSDAASDAYVQLKKNFETVLGDRGYNGITYPKKLFICTENNIPRKAIGTMIGSDEAQKNYIIKALVQSQKNDVLQMYVYMLGDTKTFAEATSEFETMGLYQKLEGAGPLANGGAYLVQYNNEGIAYKSTSDILRTTHFDAARTTAMNLPANIEGAAFKDVNGAYIYVLWSKTTTDLVETSSATYNFPAAMNVTPYLNRRDWDFSQTGTVTRITTGTLSLTATPVFLSESQDPLPVPNDPPPPSKSDEDFRELALTLYPNPTQSVASLRFNLREPLNVRVTIHSADGKLVAVAIPGQEFAKGSHVVPLTITQKLASGVYYCHFEAGTMQQMKKLVIAR